jgi:uncharacterized membrane protein SirB2
MMMLKHMHMTVAGLSILLFCFRFILTMKGSDRLNKKWLKITPHVIDTLLLVLGISLIIQTQIYPLQVTWMTEKIVAIFAYIFTGYYTLKLARNRLMQFFGFIGAMSWVVLIFRLAITKQPFLFG